MSEEAALNVEELRAFYGEPHMLARDKVMPRLDRHCREFIARSPVLVLGTADADGNRTSRRVANPPGFVKILSDGRLAIPDRPGNHRVDSLANITANPKVGLLFMVPGFNETVRVNGRATVTREPALLTSLAVQGRPAVAAILVEVEEAFFHCAKAFVRSALWDPASRADRAQMPTLGRIIADQIRGVDAAAADAAVDDDLRHNLY